MKVRHVHDRAGKHPGTHGTPRRFTVDLTEGEVDFLLAVTEGIGGDIKNSPRKYAARIHEALTAVSGYHGQDTDAYALLRGALWFTEYGTEPSKLKALYNHVKDSVTTFAMIGDDTTKISKATMRSMTDFGDAMADQLTRVYGEQVDTIPLVIPLPQIENAR